MTFQIPPSSPLLKGARWINDFHGSWAANLSFKNCFGFLASDLEFLYADGEFDEESRPFRFIVSDPNISVMISNDCIDDGQP